MGQKKLIRFEAIKSFPNVLQYPKGMAGNWQTFFKNTNPLTLELACGKGEYTVGLAKMYPDRNFLGVDIKGNRIYIGAKTSLEEGLSNAAFLRTHIDKLPDYFAPNEVAEIWLTFPDPQLRKSRVTRRLTHPKFIRLYQQILQPGGRIHLKTDSPILYQFTKWVAELHHLNILDDSTDIYAAPAGPAASATSATSDAPAGPAASAPPAPLAPELKIKTHYESLDIAQSKRIHYLRFTLPDTPLPDRDDELLDRVKNIEPTPDPRPVRPPRIKTKSAPPAPGEAVKPAYP